MGEAHGRQGLVPGNMVSEVQVDDPSVAAQLLTQSGGGRGPAGAGGPVPPAPSGHAPLSPGLEHDPRRGSTGPGGVVRRFNGTASRHTGGHFMSDEEEEEEDGGIDAFFMGVVRLAD